MRVYGCEKHECFDLKFHFILEKRQKTSKGKCKKLLKVNAKYTSAPKIFLIEIYLQIHSPTSPRPSLPSPPPKNL